MTIVRRPSSSQPLDALTGADVGFVDSLDLALDGGVDIGVVASPAPFHASHAAALLRAGATVLLEKPLSSSPEDADLLMSEEQGRVVVGYHLRLHRAVNRFRDALHRGTIGAPRRFDFLVGQHLDLWRPAIDARRSVSARWELGGGVLLELSHELDALTHVLGPSLGDPRVVAATLGVDGAPTDGRVDTVADLDVIGSTGLEGHVHLDMVRRPPKRSWTVNGEEATLVLDLLDGELSIHLPGRVEVLLAVPPNERDLAEDRLIENLVGLWRGAATPVCDIRSARRALDLVFEARRVAA
jgi:predicted dehydrogenase